MLRSTTIFGLLGIALVWAPRNELTCFYAYWIFIPQAGTFEVQVCTMAGIYLGLELLSATLAGDTVSSAVAHLLGAGLGFGFGMLLLKSGRVDCEGWDLITVWRGEEGRADLERKTARLDQTIAERHDQEEQDQRSQAPARIAFHLKNNDAASAMNIFRRTEAARGGGVLDAPTHLDLVKKLLEAGRAKDAIELLELFIERHPDGSNRARLKLAYLLLESEQRPSKALAVLGGFPQPLPADLEKTRVALVGRARQMQDEGVLELDE